MNLYDAQKFERQNELCTRISPAVDISSEDKMSRSNSVLSGLFKSDSQFSIGSAEEAIQMDEIDKFLKLADSS